MKKSVILLLIVLPVFLFSENFKYLYFKGNRTFDNTTLYEALGFKLPSLILFWKKRAVKIDPKTVPLLKESLKGFYEIKGFYKTKIIPLENNDSIIFQIEENRPVIVNKIDIKSDFPIKNLILLKKGDRFQADLFIKSKQKIKKELLKEGFCSYDLKAKALVDLEKREADLIFHLKKDGICKFGKVTIKGLESINKKIVKEYLKFKEGDKYNIDKIKESYNSLYSLGVFSSVLIEEKEKINNIVNYLISLKERKKKIKLKTGIGYETNLGTRAFFKWEEYNFRGNAKKLSFFLKHSKKEKVIKNNFFKPLVFSLKNKNFHLKNEIGYSFFDYNSYKEKKFFEKIHLFTNINKQLFDIGFGIENIKIDEVENLCNIKEGNFLLIYPFLEYEKDKRDSKLNPKKGYYLNSKIEGGIKEIGSESTYLKWESEIRVIHTFKENLTTAIKGKLGLLKELEKSLPTSKLFFAGGAYSNRAYGYHKLYATDSKCEDVGGKTMIDLSFEIDKPIYKNIIGALFFDSTLLSKDSLDFSTDFVNSIGFGIRYLTQIGPIKVDMGFNIKDPSINAIHFLIGQSF